jgi:GH25 family lysozyme M1 (1,4-beta-N-acetylmuramidase)
MMLIVLAFAWPLASDASASDFNQPWRMNKYALVLDAYELNSLDWEKIASNKRIAGFIGKASDGLSPDYCSDPKSDCGILWRKYAITRELYHSRRQLAKAHGLKWGSYHLGRAGNPREQAMHFLKFADPAPDEVIVLDLESVTNPKFMNLEDAEIFVKYIYSRLDRYPMLYANHQTLERIANNRSDYPILSRLKLWYARYKPDISDHFPIGNWDSYAFWQFSYGGNCSKKSCPYRVAGTPHDIDVNVAPMSVSKLKSAWPFDGLIDEKPFPVETLGDAELAANAVEDPEEEKHSDFIIDQDYAEPAISTHQEANTSGQSTAPGTANEKVGQQTKCDASKIGDALGYKDLESDDLVNC